jgi:shikimate dehydrogenase
MPSAPPASISGRTALVGVLGDPVRHSLSPAMHNAALRALGLDWVYLALPVPGAELAGALRALEALDCRGLNVTLPHKRSAAALAAELCPLARRLGAVNTLVRRPEGGWLGTNTDVEGFLAPLQERPWRGRRALVLGGGGSALAVLAGLEMLGFGAVQVAGRDPQRLGALVASCLPWLPQLQPIAWGGEAEIGAETLEEALAGADLVVNTTPVGMASPHDPGAAGRCPLGPAALEQLRPEASVYDLIYTPRPTALLAAASRRGCQVFDGLEMLVRQGAAALALWSGHDQVPVAVMRQAALQQLEGS